MEKHVVVVQGLEKENTAACRFSIVAFLHLTNLFIQ